MIDRDLCTPTHDRAIEEEEAEEIDRLSEGIGSTGETERREMQAKYYKMVRSHNILKYEEELTDQERADLNRGEETFSRAHVGKKVIGASLRPSVIVDNAETNKSKILKYIHSRGLKVRCVKDRGHARVELEFNSIAEANRCLEDKHNTLVAFDIPYRIKQCKGVITGWDISMPLYHLAEVLAPCRGIISLERLFKKVWNKETKTSSKVKTHVVCCTWEGSEVPKEVKIYGGLSNLKVRPYVDTVMQCFRCYKFGHMRKHCRVTAAVCLVCGNDCQEQNNCINCGGRHKPTSRKCDIYVYNSEIKKVMANEGVAFKEAIEIFKKRQALNRLEVLRNNELYPLLARNRRKGRG